MKIIRAFLDGVILYAVEKEGKYLEIKGDVFENFSVTDREISGFKLLPPVTPTKIVALGANYRKHAAELALNINSDPTIFLKPPSAVIAGGDNIVIPKEATKVDYEAELAIIIKKVCRRIEEKEARAYILGYTCANDVSERVFQKIDGQWTRAKGFDTFCPLGPCISTDIDPSGLKLEAIVNGKTVQRGNTADMINGIERTVAFVSSVMTLFPGDVILTGTPENIGPIVPEDTVEIRIDGIGSLINKVVKEK